VSAAEDITLQRLEDQIAWYDRKSGIAQRRFKWIKGSQLVFAAAIPVVATLDLHAAVAGTLGGYRARTGLVRALGVPDFPIALLEDVIAVGTAFLVLAAGA